LGDQADFQRSLNAVNEHFNRNEEPTNEIRDFQVNGPPDESTMQCDLSVGS